MKRDHDLLIISVAISVILIVVTIVLAVILSREKFGDTVKVFNTKQDAESAEEMWKKDCPQTTGNATFNIDGDKNKSLNITCNNGVIMGGASGLKGTTWVKQSKTYVYDKPFVESAYSGTFKTDSSSF